MNEWRVIPGFERYEVSDDGRVRFIATGRERKLRANERGYLYVSMNAGPATKPVAGQKSRPLTRKVHRIVAAAFIPNPDGLPQVNHIDRDKVNNAVENLEWTDNLSNHRHSADAFLSINNDKRFHKLSPDDVAAIRASLREGMRVREIAARFNVQTTTIYKINLNKTRRHEPSALEHTPVMVRERLVGVRPKPKAERNAAIAAMSEGGATLAEIAEHFGLKRKQISTIVWEAKRKAALPSRDDVQER